MEKVVGRLMSELYRDQAVCGKVGFLEGKGGGGADPYQHISQAGCESCTPVPVGLLACYGEEFSVVIELEFHGGIRYGLTDGVDYGNGQPTSGSVVVYHVDFRECVLPDYEFFRSVVVSEHFGVHEHSSRCTLVEPPHIQDRFRFAGSEKPPLSVCPSFHPGVIVIRVCPSGCVDLSGWNANTA